MFKTTNTLTTQNLLATEYSQNTGFGINVGLTRKQGDTKASGIVPVQGDEHIRIAGARYNRGLELTKEGIMQNTSYGDSILKRKSRIKELIK